MTHISLSASTQRRQWYSCSGKFSLKAHVEGSQSKPDSRGGKMSWHCHCQIYFLVSAVGCGTVGLYSFTLSLSRSGSVHFEFGRPICPAVCEWMWANQYWNLSPPSLSLSFFISCDARNTHQGAVVQESRGEVAVEAERQDVSFPAANSHFVLWQGWDSSEKTVVCYYSDDLNPQEKEAVTSSEPEAQSQVRSLKWGTVSLRSNKRVKTGDYYRSTRPRRGHELWTLHSPDPPWWGGSGAASEIHLQRQRDGS